MNNNIDVIEVLAHRRKVCKIHIPDINLSDSFRQMAQLFDPKLKYAVTGIMPSTFEITNDDVSGVYVYLGHSKDEIETTIRYEHERNHAMLGELYGYPPCCVKSFCEHEQEIPSSAYPFWRPAFELGKDQMALAHDMKTAQVNSGMNSHTIDVESTFNKYMNPNMNLLSHFPCSLSCQPSIDVARWRDQFMYNNAMTASTYKHNDTIFKFDL